MVLACVVLHNFIKLNDQANSTYCPPNYIDYEDNCGNIIPGRWRADIANDSSIANAPPISFGSNNAAREAFNLRDKLKNYFLNEGAIELQRKVK